MRQAIVKPGVRLAFLVGVLASGCGAAGEEAPPLRLVGFRQAGQTVALNEELVFSFDAPLDRTSVHGDSVALRGPEGEAVAGRLSVRGALLFFEPSLPLRADLSDGGFRPGRAYTVTLAGFPRVDGLRSRDGAFLAETRILEFQTARPSGPEPLFLDPLHGFNALTLESHELGTLDPIRLVAYQGLDPTTVQAEDFRLFAVDEPIPLAAELVENRPDGAVLELRPVTRSRGGEGWKALEPGEYVLLFEPERPERGARLRTLGGRPLVPDLPLESFWRIVVRDRIGKLRIDFRDTDLLWYGLPEGCSGMAAWGGEAGGVSIRFPRAAGDGRAGDVRLTGRGPAPVPDDGRLPVDLAALAEAGAPVDVQATHLLLPESTTVELPRLPGLVLLRAQGRLQIRGRLTRRSVERGAEPASGGPTELLRRFATRPQQSLSLSDWLGTARASREQWTVLIAGAELEIDGQVDVEGPLLLVAGGWLRVYGPVHCSELWRSSEPLPLRFPTLRTGPGGVHPLPLALDPPERNPLRIPLVFGVRSKPIRPRGGVASWGTASLEGTDGSGQRRILYLGSRMRGGRIEEIAPVPNLALLSDCFQVRFQVELEVGPEPTAAWEPPRLESLTLTWNQPASTSDDDPRN